MISTEKDWIAVGASVVIRRDAGAGRYDYGLATIERVTATQIVIREVSARFRVRDLSEVGGSRYLLNPADPAVQLAMAKRSETRLMIAAEYALQQYPRRGYGSKTPDSEDRAAIRAKLAAVLAEMDYVDQLTS
jgi:hypothetical protein